MEIGGYALSASLIYRALLDSILRRRKSIIYHYAVSYLNKLDQLASSVSNWEKTATYKTFKQELRQIHGRKTSFRAKYEGE